MTDHINLEIVTPEKIVARESAQIVMAPGINGEFGVLHGHTPFLTTLKVGILHYKDIKGTERFVFINGGFAEALPDKVTILTESAERRRDIDLNRAKQAFNRAQDRLNNQKENIDYTRAKASMLRAIHRIKIAESKSL
ncbi:MAG: F0F1 ATP synthase subunit epsilon [Desulfobacterales bacterium]|nr:F0F1 ATP synthase subunit epsilon [Desulfobacterales bacterium]